MTTSSGWCSASTRARQARPSRGAFCHIVQLAAAHDRAENDEFPITHEFMAMMLGVRRPGVSLAAGVLQKAGLIQYARGRMEVTDPPRLQPASCERYHVARREFARLLGTGRTPVPG